MAFGMSSIEMLFLMLFFTSGNDLVSLLDPVDYFKSRNIAVGVDKMAELATTAPADAKAQLGQLLALRWLADEAGEVKKHKNAANILLSIEEVAEGKKAQDPQGYAPEYARATAIALGSKLAPTKNGAPEGSVTVDALNWFPKETTLVHALDFRIEGKKESKEMGELRKKIAKMMPNMFKQEIYKFAEEVGNARFDRYSLSYLEKPAFNDSKIYIRVTGKVDHKRLVAYLRKVLPQNMQFKEIKTFRGKPIALFWNQQEAPAFALIGDNDLIFAGSAGFNPNQNALKVVEEVLDVQRGKAPSVLESALAPNLKQVSSTATGLVVGELPKDMQRNMFGPGGPAFKAFPKNVVVEMSYKDNDLVFKAQAEMDSADDAKAFVDSTKNLVQMGIAQLQNPPPLPPNFPNPDKIIKAATDLLKSIKVEANGKKLTGGMTVSEELIQSYMAMGLVLFAELGAAAPPPPGAPVQALLAPLRVPARSDVGHAPAALTLPANVVACRHDNTRERHAELSA